MNAQLNNGLCELIKVFFGMILKILELSVIMSVVDAIHLAAVLNVRKV